MWARRIPLFVINSYRTGLTAYLERAEILIQIDIGFEMLSPRLPSKLTIQRS